MAERLTIRHGNRTDCNTLCMEDCDHCWHLGIIREKLARLEDLEEQGRLIILPEDEEKVQAMNEKLLELTDIAEAALKGAEE